MAAWLRRHRGLIPYLFMLPGGLWLLVFFVLPMLTMASVALQEGPLGTGYRFTFNVGVFPEVLGRYDAQFLRSLVNALIVTGLTLAIGYPMAYTIAFRGGRYKNVLLLLVILPFFTSFIIRTISWKFILADQGFVLGTLKEIGLVDQGFRLLATPVAVISGITYNYLPFVVLPLSMSGVFAGSLLAFIPAAGDYINAELLGGTRETTMIGNVVQTLYLTNNDYPQASAISLILMAGLILGVIAYQRILRGRELTV
jgi:spermidine/putrescine transport system permease protein